MKNNAMHSRPSLGLGSGLALGLALLLAGCGALPDKPARATLYDFGPGIAASATVVAGVSGGSPCLINSAVMPGNVATPIMITSVTPLG